MAKRTFTQLIDDIDGTTATKTVSFSLNAKHYEIDLSDENADRLAEALRPWIEVARPARKQRSNNQPLDLNEIRQWARNNGHTVSNRGRIPQAVIAAFLSAKN